MKIHLSTAASNKPGGSSTWSASPPLYCSATTGIILYCIVLHQDILKIGYKVWNSHRNRCCITYIIHYHKINRELVWHLARAARYSKPNRRCLCVLYTVQVNDGCLKAMNVTIYMRQLTNAVGEADVWKQSYACMCRETRTILIGTNRLGI